MRPGQDSAAAPSAQARAGPASGSREGRRCAGCRGECSAAPAPLRSGPLRRGGQAGPAAPLAPAGAAPFPEAFSLPPRSLRARGLGSAGTGPSCGCEGHRPGRSGLCPLRFSVSEGGRAAAGGAAARSAVRVTPVPPRPAPKGLSRTRLVCGSSSRTRCSEASCLA